MPFFDAAQLVNKLTLDATDPLERDGLQEVRGQTGEGVSHYVPVSETQMVAAAFCAMSFAQQAGWLPWCGAGVTTANRTRICVRLRPPGAINENAFASACVRCGQCVQACPYDTLKLATLASGLSAGTPYLSHGIFLAKCVRTFRAPKCARAVRWIVRSNRSTTRGWGWRYWWTRKTVSTFRAALRCLLSRMPEN